MVVTGFSLRPRDCSSSCTRVRRVDSVQMDTSCRMTPISTKLSSPAGKQGHGGLNSSSMAITHLPIGWHPGDAAMGKQGSCCDMCSNSFQASSSARELLECRRPDPQLT